MRYAMFDCWSVKSATTTNRSALLPGIVRFSRCLDSLTFGLGATYELPRGLAPNFKRSPVNLYWDGVEFNSHNFRDLTVSTQNYTVGEEPLYGFNADDMRSYLSFWF